MYSLRQHRRIFGKNRIVLFGKLTTHIETVVHLINQNAKAKHHVNIGVDAEDYYCIKDSEKESGQNEK